MRKGNAWKHRNDRSWRTTRTVEKRELLSKPQFTLAALVFILTGMKAMRFRQLYQARLADDLLRYTSLSPAEVARRSGIGSAINLYQSLRRDCNMSATERRQALRQEGDEGRFLL